MNHYKFLFMLLLFIFSGVVQAQTTVQIGTDNGWLTDNQNITPFTTFNEFSIHQYLILASELTAKGQTAGTINQIAIKTGWVDYWTFHLDIRMKQTSISGFYGTNAHLQSISSNPVYCGDYELMDEQWNTFNLTTGFEWDGTSNIIIEFHVTTETPGEDSFVVYDDETPSNMSCAVVFMDFSSIDPDYYEDELLANAVCVGERPVIQLTFEVEDTGSGGNPLSLSNENYIHTITPQDAAGDDIIQSVQYFDGLGRPTQTNQCFGSGDGTLDIITKVGYDGYGRQDKQYLPATSNTSGGYTASPNYSIYGTQASYAYAQTEYEPSPLNRVKRQAAPGLAWALNSGHEVKTGYGTNSSTDAVYNFTETNLQTGTTASLYPENSLYKTTVWDENADNWDKNNPTANNNLSRTEEFKDKQGRVVLKRSWKGALPHSTYYIYNDFNQLSYVIPPLVTTEDGKVSSSELSGLCYQYKYDERKRMTQKKLPGTDWVYMVYDTRDRLRLTQDGNQRPNKKWMYTKYDQFNRPVSTGIYTHLSVASITDMRSLIDASAFYESRSTSSYTTNHGYTNSMFPTSSLDIQTVIYYDDYVFGDFASSGTYNNSSRFSTYHNSAYVNTMTTAVIGRLTGKKVKAGSAWLGSVFFYDKYGRNVMSYSQNNLAGYDVVENQYLFTGLVEKSRQIHRTSKITSDLVLEYCNYYDHMGRPDYTTLQLSGYITKAKAVINDNTYNEIGQLITKKLNSSDGTNFTQQEDYTYNIRGWLTSINNPKNLGTDYFGLTLDYETTTNISNLSDKDESYNGNISGMVWAGKYTPTLIRGGAYAFQYDDLNRLELADYGSLSGSTITDQSSLYNVTGITYDKNGNIKTLNRDGSSPGIDKLVYGYNANSNQLKYVNDTGNDAIGFKELGGNNSQEYYYDTNGNMTQDHNKQIIGNISYNHLNLPTALTQNSINISYIYDGEGNKLKSTVGSTVKNYDGQFIYEGSALSQILFEEGRIVVSGTSASYEFFMKDHLGNTRVTFDENGNLMQTLAYYPFGMEMTTDGYTDNKFRYNGKELQEGTDWYDYGARFYDPQLGRWPTVDPKTESYINESPYVYVGNRPLTMIDPDGMAYRATKDSTGAYSGFEWVDDSKAYDKNGNLLDGYFEKAILFSDNNSWSIGTYQNGRYVSYNIGSATATVYDYEESTDENGNVTKSPISTSYEASTTPSDPNKFGTVKDNMLLQAVRHSHQGRYMALQLQTLSGSSRVPASDGYNPATGESYLTGANVHRDGRNNFTGTMAAQYQLIPGGTKSFFTGNSIYSIRTKRYSGVSEGCFLINGQQWSSFMNHFPLGVGRIGVINK